MKDNQEVCIYDDIRTNITNQLQICYLNHIQNHSILVWFTIERSLHNLFDSYRFILYSIDNILLSNFIVSTLTNFTKLIDRNNSLRMSNLDSGQYEVCVEFQMNFTTYIYQPRDACIPIRIGKAALGSLKPNPEPLLIVLACAIVIFFILGLVVQWGKEKRRRNNQDNDKSRSRSSSILSTLSLKPQRDRLAKLLFQRHVDQSQVSELRQWARDLTRRHRISTRKQNSKRRKSVRQKNKHSFSRTNYLLQEQPRTESISRYSVSSSESSITRHSIYTISDKVPHEITPKKISFDLSISEEFQIT
ncbi:unnamed protein product [Rotaria sordida]|uniref:Uncharacterized protein n=1 Tax=Rotaria sordida TaxID=392033 RepID=A0A814FL13_9BILA|nr:unnamed protein product [Rotaria sordida]CAF0984439.1 unnamed protein product [Rotaria sordida]CAF1388499.1 unnamed protein product [Rotaria sordida]CAF3571961.1 unnamed protein product [Rotaria sordida]CAF3669695.1 unnamed protein product [Rotaria sordida]